MCPDFPNSCKILVRAPLWLAEPESLKSEKLPETGKGCEIWTEPSFR
jgi:hypothetical protein